MNKQELQNKIEDLEKQLAEVKEQVNSIEDEEIKKGVRWKPEYYQNYFYIDDCGKLESESYMDEDADLFRFNTGNCFKTEQEAEEYKENILTKQALKDLALELNNGVEIDWENKTQNKYFIGLESVYIKPKDCKLSYVLFQYISINENANIIYCLNKNFLTIAIDRIGKEKLIKLIKSGV